MTTSVVGRQPIVDRNRDLVGYELLFRSLPQSETADDDIPATMVDSDQLGDAMSTVVFFSTMDIGITRTVGDKLMFCNDDRGVLPCAVDNVIPPQQTVIEDL